MRDGELQRLRVRFEDKGPIVAFHWRGAPDEEAPRSPSAGVATKAEEAGLATHWGRKVLEVRPPMPLDKGRGIHWLLRDADLDAALYVGDDRTDLDAFRGLRELVEGGRLGPAPSASGCARRRRRASSRPRPTCSSTGRAACAQLLQAARSA